MSKKFKGYSNPLADLQFVSSLPLERAAGLISQLADIRHRVTLTAVDSDTFRFHIDYTPSLSRESEVRGTLRRWQGTETRIDATGTVIPIEYGEYQEVDKRRTLSFRMRDYLLQLLIDTFKAAGDVYAL